MVLSLPSKQASDYQLRHEEEQAAMDALTAQAALADQVEKEKANELKDKAKGASRRCCSHVFSIL